MLEEELRELGTHLDSGVDVRAAVRDRVAQMPRSRLRLARLLRRIGAAVVAAAVVVGVVPPLRGAVADWLGLPGVRIEVRDRLEPPPERGLDFGRPTALEDASRQVGFPLARIRTPGLPPPTVHVSTEGPTAGHVTLVYPPSAAHPEVQRTGVGLLLAQFRSDVGTGIVVKQVGPGTQVRPVQVGPHAGYWVEGRPHVVTYVDAQGRTHDESSRLVANTLLWTRDGITFRLEGQVSLDAALALAGAVG